MWIPPTLLALLAVALAPLVAAQSSNQNSNSASGSGSGSGSNSASPSPQITVIASVTTSVGFTVVSGQREQITATITTNITSTILPNPPASNPPSSQSSSASTSTTPANLPTGTNSIVTDQAPSPGATGGSFGPDDSFINAARSLKWGSALVAPAVIVGGLLVL
ncbi:hypothetical protein FB45DRAFT_917099 [Roridomyces roridus]|uniref:Uncharacterized protein n=1 Tax=Roridomyces roridus TaxID=1738132 RepID=A0AAD7FPH1_9AGAR|nr:hypothetical protein FB45DRAFT_917099 [Roridomyces roridus]